MREWILIAAGVAFLPPAALAQEQPAVVRDLGKCRAISDDTARLACFDVAAAQLDAAVTTKALTILDREGVRETKRSLFGFSVPSVGLFKRSDEPDFTEINATISRVIPLGYDKFEFVLEDGARWQTTDSMRYPPRKNGTIRIRKGALGAYFLSVNGDRGVKGKRVG